MQKCHWLNIFLEGSIIPYIQYFEEIIDSCAWAAIEKELASGREMLTNKLNID